MLEFEKESLSAAETEQKALYGESFEQNSHINDEEALVDDFVRNYSGQGEWKTHMVSQWMFLFSPPFPWLIADHVVVSHPRQSESLMTINARQRLW